MPESERPPESEMSPESEVARHEGATALRNALKLGASLMLTWSVALIVTFKLPKYLGPLHYGYYKFGDQFAMSLAVFLGLGIDTYISREVPVRPKHTTDFFLGVLVSRMMVLVPLVLYGTFKLQSGVYEEQVAAGLFGVTQIFIVLNQTFQQTLQAASRVGGLAIANVVSKVLWGGGTFAAVTLGAPFWMLPMPMLIAEALRAAVLYRATRSAVDLELKLDFSATKAVLKVSFPFFIANVAVTLGSSIDVVVLRELVPAGSKEVGWYGSAREIARLSALLSPILSGVLVPMMSRAKHRSEEAFFTILRRGIEGVNVVSMPLTLMLALGADVWIELALKGEFAPAAASLRWLAPTFVLSYGNVLLWIALMILGRSWTITIVSIVGLLLLPVFIIVGVDLTAASGPGGAGMGVAMALSLRELVIILVFLAFLGRRAIDKRSAMATFKSLAVTGVVIALHLYLVKMGPWRLLLDAIAYGVLALAVRIIRPSDVIAVLKLVRDRKKAAAE